MVCFVKWALPTFALKFGLCNSISKAGFKKSNIVKLLVFLNIYCCIYFYCYFAQYLILILSHLYNAILLFRLCCTVIIHIFLYSSLFFSYRNSIKKVLIYFYMYIHKYTHICICKKDHIEKCTYSVIMVWGGEKTSWQDLAINISDRNVLQYF